MPPSPRRILVTGGRGFVGRRLCTALAAAYPEATVLILSVDGGDADVLTEVMCAEAPEVCVHVQGVSQTETTPCFPRSPLCCDKVCAH